MDNLNSVREILAQALSIPVEEIQPGDQLLELKNMDSLVIEKVFMELEEQMNTDLDFKNLLNVETVSQLCALIDEQRQ